MCKSWILEGNGRFYWELFVNIVCVDNVLSEFYKYEGCIINRNSLYIYF